MLLYNILESNVDLLLFHTERLIGYCVIRIYFFTTVYSPYSFLIENFDWSEVFQESSWYPQTFIRSAYNLFIEKLIYVERYSEK